MGSESIECLRTRLSRRRMIGFSPDLPPAFPATETKRKTEKERQLAEGRGCEGVGEEPNHTIARKPGPL